MWQYGILYRASKLIEQICDQPISQESLLKAFCHDKYSNSRIRRILEISKCLNWIKKNNEGLLLITKAGKLLIEEKSDSKRLRLQIEQLIKLLKPEWLNLVIYGRKTLLNYVKLDTLQCFREADLTESYDAEVVAWWDNLANLCRVEKDYQKTETGRRGERLSYLYELSRTKSKPKWIAVEQSNVGYDLISQVSYNDKSTLLIEVKATTKSWEEGFFHMSRHEWEILSGSKNSTVHLWCLMNQEPMLSVVQITELNEVVPVDQKCGSWEKFSCSFSYFSPSKVNF